MLGISLGGMVAQELALTNPERIRSLTLGCTYCGGEGSALSAEGSGSESLKEGPRATANVLFAPPGRPTCLRASRPTPAWACFLEVGLAGAVALAVIMEQGRAIVEHDTSARLHEIALPTLVIHGTLDEMIPVQNGPMIAGLIPGARLEIFDDVGHLFYWERPERSAELIRAHAAVHA